MKVEKTATRRITLRATGEKWNKHVAVTYDEDTQPKILICGTSKNRSAEMAFDSLEDLDRFVAELTEVHAELTATLNKWGKPE